MAPYIAEHWGSRSRRSALIPSDVSLSPEEEAIVAERIGHRPVPPPDATESTWFATVAAPNLSPKLLRSRRQANWHDAATESYFSERTALSDECPSAEGTARPQLMTNSRDALDFSCSAGPCGAVSPRNQEKVEPTTKAGCQYRQVSWMIDIPHMSEVQSLSNKARPPGAPSMQSPHLWALVVHNAMLPNTDHDRSSRGDLSPKSSTTMEA